MIVALDAEHNKTRELDASLGNVKALDAEHKTTIELDAEA